MTTKADKDDTKDADRRIITKNNARMTHPTFCVADAKLAPTPLVAMHTLDDIRDQLRAELPYLRERYDVDRLGICGSYVREEQTDDSDLDLLVTFTETPDLFEMVNLKRHLEDTLGIAVDLAMPGALKDGPAAENIRREVEYL